MLYQGLADLVVIAHATFVAFVLFGGLLAITWPGITKLHLPAAAWGAVVEFTGWRCPLTPLETWLREQAGQHAVEGDFVLRSLDLLLYPTELTRTVQVLLGAIVLIVNGAIYGWLWRRRAGDPASVRKAMRRNS